MSLFLKKSIQKINLLTGKENFYTMICISKTYFNLIFSNLKQDRNTSPPLFFMFTEVKRGVRGSPNKTGETTFNAINIIPYYVNTITSFFLIIFFSLLTILMTLKSENWSFLFLVAKLLYKR